jgi:hypothetical protein
LTPEEAFNADDSACPRCGHAVNAHDGPHGECLVDVMHGADPDTCGCDYYVLYVTA